MNAWELPTSLSVGGVGYRIRTDFRDILRILAYFSDPDYEDDERAMICLIILFPDHEKIPVEHYEEALERAKEFIDAGIQTEKGKPTCMDWEQDAPIIIPAVNRVLGYEVRSAKELHWWTFVGAYMEIGESLFSSVVSIRSKKAKGKPLEKYEKEFLADNRSLINLKKKASKRDAAETAALNKLFGRGG